MITGLFAFDKLITGFFVSLLRLELGLEFRRDGEIEMMIKK